MSNDVLLDPRGTLGLTLGLVPLALFASTSATKVPAPLAAVASSSMGDLLQTDRLVAPLVVRLIAPMVAHLVAPLVARLIAALVAPLVALILVTALVVARGIRAESDPGPQTLLPQPAAVQALAILGRHSF